MKRDKRDDKPRLGHASKYISAPKEREKETPSKSKNSKPYAGEGGLKRLLARRKQEELDAPTEDADAQQMVDDSELEPVPPKRTSKIAEPVRAPATFARKVSAPPTSVPSFGMAGGRKPTSLRASRSRTVGPTRNRNRFSAAYEDDEPDDVDDPGAVLEEPPKDKEDISGFPKFEAPSGFSFAPVRVSLQFDSIICNAFKQPSSVASIPQASDTSSVHDELPITALPFTFSKVPSVPSPTPPPVADAALQPPVIALVPPTPLAEKPQPEPALPNFFANSQIFARTGVPPPQTEPRPVSEPDAQPANKTSQASESVSGTAAPDSQTVPNPSASIFGTVTPSPLASTSSPESQKPTQPALQARTESIFGPPLQAQSMSTSSTQSSNSSSLPFSLTPSSTSQPTEKKDASPAPRKPLFGGAMNSFRGFGPSSPAAPVPSPKPETQSAEVTTHAFSFPKATTPAPAAEAEQTLKPALPISSPALTSASLPATAPMTENSKPPAPFSFGQSTKESVTTAPAPPSTPAKSLFSFGAPSATPTAPAEKAGAAPNSFTFASTTPTSTPSGFLFGSLATQSETKPATGSGFSFGTPGPTSSDTSKPTLSFGTSTPARPLTPPSAEDGMRMEESPTRGGGVDANSGSAKPQSLPQLQMPGKAGFAFGSNTGTAFGSALPSPFGATPTTGLTFGQQNQATSQGTSGGFAFNANPKSSEGASGGFSFGTTKPAENTAPTGFSFGQPVTESRPSSSSGFAFNQPGPKTADATSSGFSFKAPESIQHSTSFTFGQTAPEPARTTSSSGFAFGQTPAQTPAAASPFAFGSSVNSGAFGSAPASPAFGTQPLAPTSTAPFSFGGPTSAPPQQPAPNPFGFGSGAGQPTSPAVQQGFGFNFGGGTPQTPTGTFGASTPQTPTTGNSGNPVFTMGGAPPPGNRLVKKLPRRPNAKR
jgi:nucleoporin NUP1